MFVAQTKDLGASYFFCKDYIIKENKMNLFYFQEKKNVSILEGKMKCEGNINKNTFWRENIIQLDEGGGGGNI